MTQLTFKPLSAATDEYDLFLLDLWGVIVKGGKVYSGVIDIINQVIEKKDVMFLTNAPRPAVKIVDNLQNWGMFNVTKDMVITSGDIARQVILEKKATLNGKIPVIFHLGADRNDDLLSNFTHELTDDLSQADILLLSIYRDEHEDIREFDELLEQAAKKPDLLNICSNPDTTIPKHGILRYCAGYFAGIIEKFGGTVIYTGKPKNAIYNAVFKRKQGIKKNRILMIGDTFETDIIGANNAGINSALVLSGNSLPFHNMHKSMDDKLSALSLHAREIGIIPTFVTQTVIENAK